MIRFESFAFASPPGTREDLFLESCKQVGLQVLTGIDPHSVQDFNSFPGFKVSLVRHPVTWFLWVWENKEEDCIVKEFRDIRNSAWLSSCFETFVLTTLDSDNGLFTKLMNRYQADIVLKLEEFPWALEEFHQTLNDDCNNSFGVLRDKHNNTEINPSIRSKIIRDNWDFCQRYGYY